MMMDDGEFNMTRRCAVPGHPRLDALVHSLYCNRLFGIGGRMRDDTNGIGPGNAGMRGVSLELEQ